MHQEHLGKMTADQNCLHLPQIYCVKQSLREVAAGTVSSLAMAGWRARPFDPAAAPRWI